MTEANGSLKKSNIAPGRNRSALILAANRENGINGNVFLKEILFCPIVALAAQTCKSAQIDNVFILSDSSTEENISANAFKGPEDEKPSLIISPSASINDIVRKIKDVLADLSGYLLLLRGDIPFIDSSVLENSYSYHCESGFGATVLTTKSGDENRSAVWFSIDALKSSIDETNNLPQRCPLHLLPDMLWQKGKSVGSFYADNPEFALRASSARDIFELNGLLCRRVLESHIERGVEFLSLDGILIGQNVKIGKGTTILPGTILKGGTEIGSNCVIGPNSLLEDCIIGDNTKFNASQGYSSKIGSHVTIGPFCHIRPDSSIESGVHLGDFVEIKNSTLGENTHVSHLTYVGDSDVGRDVNFGCGVVTVNYNGKSKARCKIGDGAFIGCNTNLVAPVEIGQNGYVAAGSTIVEDVPVEAMAIARARQVNKEGYNKKLR